MANHCEADIVVSGVPLSEAQSMTLRVAVASWLIDLSNPDRLSELGSIGPLYRQRLVEIQSLISRMAR